MATSALLVEIIVIGVLTLIALLCDLANWSYPSALALHKFYLDLHLGTATGAAIIFGIAYPVGWAINSLAYVFFASILRSTDSKINLLQKPKFFCEEFFDRLTKIETIETGRQPDANDFLGDLGNYYHYHATTMQEASEYSTRLLTEHFSMLRIDRASFLISVIFLPASFPWRYNFLWVITIVANMIAVVILYFLTKKAYVYYKGLRNTVYDVIQKEIVWERSVAERKVQADVKT